MEFYKRVLKLHHFRNLGRNLPAELLLNSSFEKHGGLVVLVGENNVGKSNVLEALKIFNDADVKLCSENDCFKAHEKDSLLSLEEETILDRKITGFSCVDLKIQSKEVNKGLKELSKTLIVYPFSAFIGEFIKLVMSYGILDSFLKFYKEKLKLGAFATRQANNLLFKELIKHLSGNNQLVKNFCQCIREIIEYNAPNNKEYKPNQ
ncbi:ATP-binding protein, partial [Helicobacter pylori]|nr:ATP-binding protein [Helicobacter pylori]